MLSIKPLAKNDPIYYLELAQEDYYLDGGEPPGRWAGSAASVLDLGDVVEDGQLRQLWQGFAPSNGTPLLRNAGKESHLPGWDLTFSADKSVSTLWSQADESTRRRIQAIHDASVRSVIDYIEREMAWTRSRDADGGFAFHRAKIAAATFQHGTNRNLDPNLHTHVVLMNVGLADGGRSGALYSPAFVRHKLMLGAMYRVELFHRLEQELGLTSHRVKTWAELDGVDKELARKFSSRRAEIEDLLAKYGAENAKLAQAAALMTRATKENVPRAELFEEWQKIGRELGWSTKQAQQLLWERSQKRERVSLATIMDAALEETMRFHNRFTREGLLKQTLTLAQSEGFGAGEVVAATSRFLAESPAIKPLMVESHRALYTTHAMWESEIKLVQAARRLADSRDAAFDADQMAKVLEGFSLNAEQTAAFHHLTDSNKLGVVTGLAGTGKTYLLNAAREAFEANGYRVIGAALAGKAASELQEGAGIEASTIHGLLGQMGRGQVGLDHRTVLVVDEAGMVHTDMMRRLVGAVEASGARLVLTGDARQLQPIEAGGPFQSFLDRFQHEQLSAIRRQNQGWARDAVKAMADGDAQTVLKTFAEHGQLTVKQTPFEAMDALMERWRERAASDPRHHLILAPTNQSVDALNRMAQAIRRDAGQLGERAVAVGSRQFRKGDRLLFTRNSRWLDVRNGQVGTVLDADPVERTLKVKLDRGPIVDVPLEHYDHVKLGYAITTHKSQGLTVGDDRQGDVYVYLGGGRQDREMSYVQISRAKQHTHLFADRETGGDQLEKLAQSMSRSHRKDLVIDQWRGVTGVGSAGTSQMRGLERL